jgi:hypothetical protein
MANHMVQRMIQLFTQEQYQSLVYNQVTDGKRVDNQLFMFIIIIYQVTLILMLKEIGNSLY